MRDCIRFAPLIGAREGELTPGEAKALALHLRECGTCSATAADFAATDGLVREALLDRANARDFAPFVDQVMARVGRAERPGILGWLGRHRRGAAAALVPALAAAALIVYVRLDGGRDQIAMLELTSEGEVTTVLQTSDGPVVLLLGESDT
jgi:anti-sigma factor RsiW